MIGFPLDSHVSYDTDGTPMLDRAITSAPLRELIKKIMTDGVLPNPSTNLQVTTGNGMTLEVKSGFAIVNGCMKLEESSVNVTLDVGESSPRIDTIVVRLDDNDDVRSCEIGIRKGVASSNPVPPELTRSESVYEIGLANVTVPANSSEISASNINDTRYDSNRCGIISAIAEFDTTTIYNQIQADLSEFKYDNETDFEEWSDRQKNLFLQWFATIQDILDEETAGHLQNEINKITPTELTGTLAIGQTTLSFTNAKITDDALYDVYTDVFGVIPQNMEVDGNELTILFDEQETDVSVKVLVREVLE